MLPGCEMYAVIKRRKISRLIIHSYKWRTKFRILIFNILCFEAKIEEMPRFEMKNIKKKENCQKHLYKKIFLIWMHKFPIRAVWN